MADQSLLLAAGIFAASSAFGAAVSHKEDVRGAPLGIDLPGSVAVHLAVGWGSGLTAPWPMPALALGAAICAGPQVRWARPTCKGLGIAILVGTIIEPVTWGRRPSSTLTAAAVSLNLIAAVALATAGRRRTTTTLQYGAPEVAPGGVSKWWARPQTDSNNAPQRPRPVSIDAPTRGDMTRPPGTISRTVDEGGISTCSNWRPSA